MANPQRRVPPWLGATLLFAAVVVGLFWPVLAGQATFVHGDSLSVSLPLQKLLASGLSEGRIPQWSAAIYGGHPVLAEGQGGFLHPLNWLLFGSLPALFDAPGEPVGAGTLYAHGLLHLVCTWIAACGCFGLCRTLGLGVAASIFAALALAFSQDWLGLSGNSAIALSTAALPGAAWAAERWWRTPGPGTAAVLGAAVALSLLGGYPQAVHALAIGLAVSFLVRGDAAFWRSPGRHVATGLLAVAIALGLAAMQLLPTVELVGESVRAQGVELAYPGSPLRQLRGLLFSGGRLGAVEPGLGSLLVLLLAGIGVGVSRVRLGWGLAALLLFQLGIAEHSPVYRALDGVLPGLDRFRITHLYSTVGLVGIAVLSGFGVERLIDMRRDDGGWRALIGQAGVVCVLLVVLAVFARHDEVRAVGYLFPALALVGTAALLVAGRPAWLAPGLVGLLLLEIAVMRAPLHDFVPSGVAQQPPATAAFLRDRHPHERDFRIANVPHFFSFIGFAPPDAANLEHLASLYLASLDAGSNLLWELPSLNANLALPLARRAAVSGLVEREVQGEGARPAGARFVDLQAVRYVVARERTRETPYAPDLERVFFDPETRFFVLENPAALSRLQLVPGARVSRVAGLDEALASFDMADRSAAVLEQPEGAPQDPGAGAPVPSRIVRAELEDERILVEVEAVEPVYLVVADAPYPAWAAELDGEPATILPANVLGKAVALPPGRHEVVLRFRSRAFALGLAITGATLALVLAGAAWRRGRRAGR